MHFGVSVLPEKRSLVSLVSWHPAAFSYALLQPHMSHATAVDSQ
jgi:hypothetical protein